MWNELNCKTFTLQTTNLRILFSIDNSLYAVLLDSTFILVYMSLKSPPHHFKSLRVANANEAYLRHSIFNNNYFRAYTRYKLSEKEICKLLLLSVQCYRSTEMYYAIMSKNKLFHGMRKVRLLFILAFAFASVK